MGILAVPAVKLLIRETSKAIASAEMRGLVALNEFQREEVTYWRFLDDWQRSLPWREEKHCRISLSTDASNYSWGCVIHQLSGDLKMGDYWNDEQKELFISSKEMLALVHAIRALPEEIRDARVDACVDSKVMIGAWEGQGGKTSLQLIRVTKQLFREVSSRNIQISLQYVESDKNKVEAPSRRLSRTDSKLSAEAFVAVDHAFGGVTGHSFDLMALDSNAVMRKDEKPLPHFTPHPSPCSAGVNLFCQDLTRITEMPNPYVFSPFGLIGPVLKFLLPFRIPFTIVVPEFIPPPYWWPELMSRSIHTHCLGKRGDKHVLLSPSKFGYMPVACPAIMWACRVGRFSQ